MRNFEVKFLDNSIKSVTLVDLNQTVANLMVVICTRLGLPNSDEYSLAVINNNNNNNNNNNTNTINNNNNKDTNNNKDAFVWLDHSKTLAEQGITNNDHLVFKRKFYFSDQNVDLKDPLGLDILYLQVKDEIIKGIHPVSVDGACKFAAIQLQAQYGSSVGNFNVKDFLPAEHAKIKQIDRKILNYHKNYYGLGPQEAKLAYINEARLLPTYGATFFLVKEKVKNKLVPRLFGITKDCVMRVDADTRTILKTWPLTTVKRWAASLNSFTLDFGDYSDSYYTLQTSEGEQISQYVAGYIDLILKRKKQKDHFGVEGDEGCTMIEHEVAPSRAIIIQHQRTEPKPPANDARAITPPPVQKTLTKQGPIIDPPEYRPAVEIKGKAEVGFEKSPITRYVSSYSLTDPQENLQRKIKKAHAGVDDAQRSLNRPAETSNIEEHELDVKKQKLANKLSSINAAAAQLVSLSTQPEENLDYSALNEAVETVTHDLPDMAREIKIVASTMESEEGGEQLLEAARRLCKAFSDLLTAAEPGPAVPRQTLISAASRVGDATQSLLYNLDQGEQDRESAEILLSLAKGVANAAAALVLKAKDVASNCREEEADSIVSEATRCALATSHMVTTAKIVAPTFETQKCQKQLMNAYNEVYRAVDGIKRTTHGDVDDAAHRVDRNLDRLIKHSIREETAETTISGMINDLQTTTLYAAAGTLRSHDNNEFSYYSEHILRTAKALVEDIKTLVSNSAGDEHQLNQAAQEACITMKRLSDFVVAGAASLGPANSQYQTALIAAVKKVATSLSDLIGATRSALGADLDDPSMMQVKDSANVMVGNVTSLLNEIINCGHLLNSSDPSVIAENELLGAASQIDAAARKLENLKPRTSSIKLPHEELNFDEMILEAARCIIEATAALLRAASATQRELIVDGRLDQTSKFYASDNNQWSEGLVSAARMVAAATHTLVEAANELVQGQAGEERLISAAKQVASSTNQLLVACKVKADPESKNMLRLHNAGFAVKKATDNLVRAAQKVLDDEEQSLMISNKRVSGIAQEISAREQILKKEKELEVAKTKLVAIRKAKYSNSNQGYGGDL